MLLTTLLLDVLVLTGGTVHSMVPGVAPVTATVIVRDGRIESVVPSPSGGAETEPDSDYPAGAEVVDLTGLHLVPGLIDALVNFDADHDALYLNSGIALVRDLGHDPGRVNALRESGARAHAKVPELLTGGVVLDGDPPATPEAAVVRSAVEVDHAIQGLDENHLADFISIQAGLKREAWERIIEKAHEHELEVWGPVPYALKAGDVAGKQDGVFYLDAFLPEGVDWSFVQPGAFAATAEAYAKAGTYVIPVLMSTGYRLRAPDAAGGQAALDRLSPHYESWWLGELEERGRHMRELGEDYLKQGTTVIRKQLALIKQLHDAGVKLVPGSAAPHPWLSPGWALHDELALWVEAGIPPGDVLDLATRGAAAALGVAAERGTIEPGKVADLLIVKGDPLADMSVLRRPVGLVLHGAVLSQQELAALEARQVERQGEARRALRAPLDIPALDLPLGEVLMSGEVQTLARGLRISAERWAVVALTDGKRAYCSRILTPGGGVFEDSDLTIRQVTKDGRLEDLEVKLQQGEQELVARGTWVAQTFRIERRLDGDFLSNESVPQRPVTVNLGSVTAQLMIEAANPQRGFPVLDMQQGLEPALAEWGFLTKEEADKQGADAATKLVRTQQGGMAWQLAEDGSIALVETYIGSNVSRTSPVRRGKGAGTGLEEASAEAADENDAATPAPVEATPAPVEAADAVDAADADGPRQDGVR